MAQFRQVAIILAIIGALLVVLAVASFIGSFPLIAVANVTPGEFGALAALALVGAGGMFYAAEYYE